MKISSKSVVKIKPHVVNNDLYKTLLTELAEVVYDFISLSKQSISAVTESKGLSPYLLTPTKGVHCGKS